MMQIFVQYNGDWTGECSKERSIYFENSEPVDPYEQLVYFAGERIMEKNRIMGGNSHFLRKHLIAYNQHINQEVFHIKWEFHIKLRFTVSEKSVCKVFAIISVQ